MLKRFGPHIIQYGVVKDHGIYEHFHVSIEVNNDAPTTGIVILNGREIGAVEFIGKKQFEARRKINNGLIYVATCKTVGKAAAAVISDFAIE